MWAVVPVKEFGAAKKRLAKYLRPADRRALVVAMLSDVLEVLQEVDGLTEVLVVTRDSAAAAMSASLGATVLEETGSDGLNAALEQAIRHLQKKNAAGMIVVPADLPALRTSEVDSVLEGHRGSGAVTTIVADRHGQGTNCLACSPLGCCDPQFGVESFRAHRSFANSSGAEVRVLELPGFQFDLDTVADLNFALELPIGPRTRRALSGFALGQAREEPRGGLPLDDAPIGTGHP